ITDHRVTADGGVAANIVNAGVVGRNRVVVDQQCRAGLEDQHAGAGRLRQRVGSAHRGGAFVGGNVVAGNRGARAARDLNRVGADVLGTKSGNSIVRNRAAAAGV